MNYGAHHEGMRGQNFCIIERCMKKTGQLFPVPHKNSSVFNKWIRIVSLSGYPGHRICGDHFKPDDFLIATRRYLKPNSVPSRGINSIKSRKLVIYTKEDSDESDNEERAVPEHGYCLPLNLPCSRTICFVSNCTARAGNGIKLHKFPLEDQAFLKKWTAAIKTRKKPSKYSRVCSRHFKNDDYLPGTYRLMISSDIVAVEIRSFPTRDNRFLSKSLREAIRPYLFIAQEIA
ncbi:hypothetical protein RP20_CCG016010 [Aedes albopictus]|nr:hypothetical protein RP20_CCG016010 [Aedes albopictus]